MRRGSHDTVSGFPPAKAHRVFRTSQPSFRSRKAGSKFRTRDRRSLRTSCLPKDGEQVLDYCAGGGGKTLAMAAAMHNKGQVHAYDADRKRLAPIIERLKRAGTRNVQVHDDAKALSSLARALRQGAGRCALHRHRHLAPPPGYEVAADGKEPRRAHRSATGRA